MGYLYLVRAELLSQPEDRLVHGERIMGCDQRLVTHRKTCATEINESMPAVFIEATSFHATASATRLLAHAYTLPPTAFVHHSRISPVHNCYTTARISPLAPLALTRAALIACGYVATRTV